MTYGQTFNRLRHFSYHIDKFKRIELVGSDHIVGTPNIASLQRCA